MQILQNYPKTNFIKQLLMSIKMVKLIKFKICVVYLKIYVVYANIL